MRSENHTSDSWPHHFFLTQITDYIYPLEQNMMRKDFLGELCLLNTAKSMISSLSGTVMLWASGSPSPMQTPVVKKGPVATPQRYDHLQLGLKTLIYTQPNSEIIHSYMALSTSASKSLKKTPPSPLSASSVFMTNSPSLDDLIGTDSGVHILISSSIKNIDDISNGRKTKNNNVVKHLSYKDRIHDKRAAKSDKYPPPLPWLGRTSTVGNLANYRGRSMPWIWSRNYEDGKLILQGQPLERHEYFEARRYDGRLILDLVSIQSRHQMKSIAPRSRSCCEDEYLMIQFGEEDDHDKEQQEVEHDDESVAVFESVSELSCLEINTPSGLSSTYNACGIFMDIHERSSPYSAQASSSAPLVTWPMTSVII